MRILENYLKFFPKQKWKYIEQNSGIKLADAASGNQLWVLVSGNQLWGFAKLTPPHYTHYRLSAFHVESFETVLWNKNVFIFRE